MHACSASEYELEPYVRGGLVLSGPRCTARFLKRGRGIESRRCLSLPSPCYGAVAMAGHNGGNGGCSGQLDRSHQERHDGCDVRSCAPLPAHAKIAFDSTSQFSQLTPTPWSSTPRSMPVHRECARCNENWGLLPVSHAHSHRTRRVLLVVAFARLCCVENEHTRQFFFLRADKRE